MTVTDVREGKARRAVVMTWLDHLKSMQKKGENDPDSAFEDFNSLTKGKFRPPKEWRDMSLERRARYLSKKFPLEDQ